MIKLGMLVKDRISGFSGIAIATSRWLFGCNQVCVAPTQLKDGKRIEGEWFDEERLEAGKQRYSEADFRAAPTGGPSLGGPPPRSIPPSR